MSAEDGNNRSDRVQKLFDQVSADIAAQSPGLEPAQEASAPQGQEAPAEMSTNDGKAPSDVGVTPGAQKEPEVRRHVVIPFSRETYANLERLRELGLRPTYRSEGNFWSGDLGIGERRELHKNGVPTSFAVGVEVPGDHWTYEARDQLKEFGLYWDRASETWCGLVDVEDLESLARSAYMIGIRVYAYGKDLTREYRIEEYRARKREPTFIPDRPTVLGLDDEVLDKETTRYAKLVVQSFRALSSEAREEIGQLLVELRIPTDPETAELAWTELRPVEAGDIRAIAGAPAPAAYSPSSVLAACSGRSPSEITSGWSTGKDWTVWRPSTVRSLSFGRTICTRRRGPRRSAWLRPCGGSTTRSPRTTSLASTTGDLDDNSFVPRDGPNVPGCGVTAPSLARGWGASHPYQRRSNQHACSRALESVTTRGDRGTKSPCGDCLVRQGGPGPDGLVVPAVWIGSWCYAHSGVQIPFPAPTTVPL